MTITPLERIVVVGNDISAWMACAVLSMLPFPSRPQVTLYAGVESVEDSAVQSVLPNFAQYLSAAGITEEQIIKECDGCHKLGYCYHLPDGDFYHAWGEYGAARGAIEFHQLVIGLKHKNYPVSLNELAIAASAAAQQRFAKPVSDFSSIRSTYESSLAFSTRAFINLLKQACIARDVDIDMRSVKDISSNESGERANILLSDGTAQEADFIINAAPHLLQEDDRNESWSGSLPFNRSEEVVSNDHPRLVTDVYFNSGLSWEKIQYTKHSKHRTRFWAQSFSTEHLIPGQKAINAGCLIAAWHSRIINIGSAAVRLASPLVSNADLAWIAISGLLKYFPSADVRPAVVAEYNNIMIETYRNLRDLTQLIMLLASRKIPDFFRAEGCTKSANLTHKEQLFEYRGRLPVYEYEIFKTEWQLWLLLGLGMVPQRVEPIAMQISEAESIKILEAVSTAVKRESRKLPMYS